MRIVSWISSMDRMEWVILKTSFKWMQLPHLFTLRLVCKCATCNRIYLDRRGRIVLLDGKTGALDIGHPGFSFERQLLRTKFLKLEIKVNYHNSQTPIHSERHVFIFLWRKFLAQVDSHIHPCLWNQKSWKDFRSKTATSGQKWSYLFTCRETTLALFWRNVLSPILNFLTVSILSFALSGVHARDSKSSVERTSRFEL